MKQLNIKKRVCYVVKEIDDAYRTFSDHDNMNADYAEFAGMAINQFRDALSNPALSREDFKSIFRDGLKKHRAEARNSDWAKFLASHITLKANENPVRKYKCFYTVE